MKEGEGEAKKRDMIHSYEGREESSPVFFLAEASYHIKVVSLEQTEDSADVVILQDPSIVIKQRQIGPVMKIVISKENLSLIHI